MHVWERTPPDNGARLFGTMSWRKEMKIRTSRFQDVIETVEALPPEDQALLVEIIRQRLIQHRRRELAAEIAEAREAYRRGEVHRGMVADLMEELTE